MRKWLDQYDIGGPKPGSVYHVAPFNNGFSVGYTTEPNTIYIYNPSSDSWTKLSGSSYDTFSKQNPGIISSAPSAPKVKEKFVPKPDKVNVKEDLKKVEEKKSVQTSQEKAAESYKNLPADKKLPEIEVQGYNGLFSKYYNYLRDNYDKFSDLPVFSDYLKKKLDKAFAKGKYTSPVLRLAGIDKDQGQQAFAEQQARIISDYYANNNPGGQYTVLDKSRGTLSLYNGDDFVKEYSVGTGENVGDKITRTVKKKNKVDWDAGNKMTGAGIYTVGKVVPQNEEYSMAPTWNFYSEKNQEDFVPMAMHSIPRNLMSQRLPNIQDTDLTNNRVTNGCINGVCFDLHDLYNQGFGMGEKMYVLPDNPANSYYVEDGQLKFRAVGQPGAYNTSPDVFKPLVFNFDENKFKNQVFQESDSNNEQEYNNTTVPFLNALQSDENKKAIMKATGISSDLYNNLAKMAFGIYGAESNYGDEHNWFNNLLKAGNKLLSKVVGYTASSPDVTSKAETYGQTDPEDSVGWTQFKWSNLDEAEKNLANSLGITSNTDLLDPAKSALFTTAILAQRYNVNLNDKQKANYWQELPLKWNKASNYPDRVKQNADAYLSYKSGGSTKRLKQYADGGTRTCPDGYIWDSKLKTCVKLYTDLGEFKIANQAYQDSSDAYNKTKDIQNPKYYTDGNPSWYSFNGSTQEAEKFMKKNNMDLDFDGKFPGKIQPTETGYFGEGVSYPIYKKPQPVRYVKNPDDENVEIRNYGLILPYYPPEEPIKLNSKPVTRLQGYTTPTTLNPASLPENMRQDMSRLQDKSLSWEDTMKKYSDKYPGMEPIYQMTNNREGVGNQKLMGFTYRDYYDQENPRKFRPKEYRFEQKMGGTTGWLDQYEKGGPGKPKAKIDFGKGVGVMPVDINSQLYREIYPNLMSSGIDPATGQSTMYGTPMEGITVVGDSPQHWKDFRKYKQEYLNKDRSAFRDWYDALGYNTKSVNDRAERYGYDKASKELLEKGVENLTEGQKEFISKSAYANKLEPGIFQRFQKAFTNPGFNLETLGNVVAPLEYTSNLVRGIMTGDVMAGLRGEPTNEYFRTDNMPAGYNPQELSIANNALTIATDPLAEMVALEEAPIRLMSAGSKGVGNILKPLANSKLMSYGKDLAYSIPKGKLPTYTNVGRWQPDAVPQWLTEAGETLTDEQKLLTGLWHTSRIGDQVPFYMRTRPGAGNLNLARLSDRQIAELENKMSAAAKGMSGKTNSVAASDDYLKGELIVPKDVNAFRKTIRFDINPQEYIPPANASKEWGDIKVGNFTDQLVKAQYPNILGIPRFYFPFKKGGSTGWLDQYDNGGPKKGAPKVRVQDPATGEVKEMDITSDEYRNLYPTLGYGSTLPTGQTSISIPANDVFSIKFSPNDSGYLPVDDYTAPASSTYVDVQNPYLAGEAYINDRFQREKEIDALMSGSNPYYIPGVSPKMSRKWAENVVDDRRDPNVLTVENTAWEGPMEVSYAAQVRSDKQAKPLIENNPQGDRTNVEWFNSFTPEQQEILKYSNYASMFEPELWRKSLQGLESAGRYVANFFNPVNDFYKSYTGQDMINRPFYTIPGYTAETARNVNPLETLSFLQYPQKAVQGYLTNSSYTNPLPFYTYNNYGSSNIGALNAAATMASDPLLYPLIGESIFNVAGKVAKLPFEGYNQLFKNNPLFPTASKLESGLSQSGNIHDLEELRRVYHNSERFLTLEEANYLHKHGHGLPQNYITSANQQPGVIDLTRHRPIVPTTPGRRITNVGELSQALDEWLTANQIDRSNLPSDMLSRTQSVMDRHGMRGVTGSNIEDLISNLSSEQQQNFLTDLYHNFDNIFTPSEIRNMRRPPSPSSFFTNSVTPTIRNRSGFTKEEALAKTAAKDKDKLSKLTEDEFRNTALKPNGEIVEYTPGTNIEKMTYDTGQRRTVLTDRIPMTEEEYTGAFNENIDLLNQIIADRNKTGIQYRVKELDKNGRLIFVTPPGQTYTDDLGNIVSVPEGQTTWSVNINPGQWRGDVEDIINTEYFKSIPGLEMSNTSSGVFADNIARRGSGTYEALNEYLKRLDLGRVKPGFNSQTDYSRGAWENFVNSGRAFGFYGGRNVVYGSMKKDGGSTNWLDQYGDGGPIIPELPEDFLHKANVYAWNQARKAAQSSENAFLEENSRINQMRQKAENNAYSHDPSWDNKPFCITLPNGQPYCATRTTEVLKESGFPLSITPSSRNLEDQLTKEKGWIPVDRPSVPGDISITRRPGRKAWHTMMSAGNNVLYGDSGSGQDWHSYNYRGLPAMNRHLNGDTHFYRYQGNLPALQEDMQHKNFEYMYKTYLEPKKKGGVKTSADGYIDYLKGKGSNAYSIFAKGGSKGWLDNYK